MTEEESDAVQFGKTVGALLDDPGLRRSMGQAARALGQPGAARRIVELLYPALKDKPVHNCN